MAHRFAADWIRGDLVAATTLVCPGDHGPTSAPISGLREPTVALTAQPGPDRFGSLVSVQQPADDWHVMFTATQDGAPVRGSIGIQMDRSGGDPCVHAFGAQLDALP